MGKKTSKKTDFLFSAVAVALRLAAGGLRVVIEVDSMKLVLQFMETIYLILNVILLIIMGIRSKMGKLKINQYIVCRVVNSLILIASFNISLLFFVSKQLLFPTVENPEDIIESEVYTFNFYYLSFFWIISVYICYSLPVQRLVIRQDTPTERVQVVTVLTIVKP
ncbi:hypothetical protein GCK72_011559 [Caenorhabditis remanei]|uniref:Uncharacterized protein n=1 Tax=Caenorhabditis remanei TaxID=31234 RepID=A0A6A5HA37_CAERE|nr:hypothetical protein GCK72_011559 [Caenorhabditis remanei]KAF1763293.1 hypothetical protein GCK72_011559 [Caenorhabditis remanei]